MNAPFSQFPTRRDNRAAFTLVELLIVIAVLALLAATLAPTLARSKPKSGAVRCMNNQRQLMAAWRIYAEDNNDYLAGNDFPFSTFVSSITPQSSAACWAPGDMTVTGDKTNVAILKNPVVAQLFNYLKTASVYKCPADKSSVVRSISMSGSVGTRWCNPPASTPRGKASLDGAWLSGAYTTSQTTWLTYGKFSSMTRPSPANLWVIMDEHPGSINDSAMATMAWDSASAAGSQKIIDFPASNHNGAAGIAFADGHSEIHFWQDARTKPPVGGGTLVLGVNSANNVDVAWLGQRTSARR